MLKTSRPLRARGWIMTLLTGWLAATHGADRPNILWLTCEDTGPELGCYGDAYAETPALDRLAARGLRFRQVWSNAPVCAPARTTLILGVYPSSVGAEHMRSEVRLPAFMKLYPQLLREAGYYCSNHSKEDYNVTPAGQVWDESSNRAHWKNRKPGQPFFAIFNFTVTHESAIRARPHTLQHDPARAPLPEYHPDTPEVRHDWAQYYDKISEMDRLAGARLEELDAAGLREETIVFFYGDHGSGMPRSKRWPYNSGLHVPLLVYVPEKYRHLAPAGYRAGGVSDQLVSFVDFAPTLLSLVGRRPPDWMQGRAFMGPHAAPPRAYLFGFRGRMDERYDLVRSVRNGRHIYIRNYMPHRIYGQYLSYMFETPTTQVWKRLYDEGRLRPPQTHFWEPKPAEELYDLEHDRSEVRNLAGDPAHAAVLGELRRALREHLETTRDVGFLPEAEMHARAAGTSIYEAAQDRQRYPMDRILAMTERASLGRPDAWPELQEGLGEADAAVRYWAALGLLMRGAPAVAAARRELEAALRDPSPCVRIAAAEALGQYGDASELSAALAALRDVLPPDRNGAYVSMLALNAVAALGPKAAPLLETLRTLPTNDPHAVARANEYVPRLVKELTSSLAPSGD